MHLRRHWLITYDIADELRLVRVQRLCERYGAALQHSVYQCELNDATLLALQRQMLLRIDSAEDTVAYYPVCTRDGLHAASIGACSKDGLETHDHWVV